MKLVRQLLYIECGACKVWIIAGKGAAAEALTAQPLKAAAKAAGWQLGARVLCPACLQEGRR